MSEKKITIKYKHTAITAITDKNLKNKLLDELIKQYTLLEEYLHKNPFFATTYEPIKAGEDAPKIAQIMADAAEKTGVGPMASVAGAYADILGEFLQKKGAKEAIIENGGDIYIKTKKERIVGVYAGPSKFSNKIGFLIKPEDTPCGICTSSDTVGHSISLGRSDAVTVFADTAALADAAATAIGNQVKGKDAIKKAIKKAREIKEIRGAIIIQGETLGAYGKIPEIIKTPKHK